MHGHLLEIDEENVYRIKIFYVGLLTSLALFLLRYFRIFLLTSTSSVNRKCKQAGENIDGKKVEKLSNIRKF